MEGEDHPDVEDVSARAPKRVSTVHWVLGALLLWVTSFLCVIQYEPLLGAVLCAIAWIALVHAAYGLPRGWLYWLAALVLGAIHTSYQVLYLVRIGV